MGLEICCGMAVKWMGMLGVCEEDEGTNWNMETVTLIYKCR